jgi:hypothetical protein
MAMRSGPRQQPMTVLGFGIRVSVFNVNRRRPPHESRMMPVARGAVTLGFKVLSLRPIPWESPQGCQM